MPAHADNISINLDTTAVTLQRSGNLYKHNSSVRVRNSNTYGFTLSMNADQPNLVNDKDSTYKIDSVSGTNQQLAANQWGYGMGKDSTTFNSVSSATLADVTSDSKGNCTSVDDCTLYLTFGANLDPKHLPTGSYSTSLTYTATSKPAPYVPPTPPAPAPEPPAPEPYVPPESPKPKWTTNGCYYSNGDWHNCTVGMPTDIYARPVVWKDNSWYGFGYATLSGWFNYRTYTYYHATWAHAAILTESGEQKYLSIHGHELVKLDSNDIIKILAFVPAYSRQGNYINFCGYVDTTTHECEYSDVGSTFNESMKSYGDNSGAGFWVGLHAMGCTNAPDESKCDYRCDDNLDALQDYHGSDAKKVADTLAEALGSPCY